MIRTFMEINVKPGMEQRYIDGVEAGRSIFDRADGCHGLELHQSIEDKQHFIVCIEWDNLANDTEVFHNTSASRILLGDLAECFADEPKIWHGETVMKSGRFRRFDDLPSIHKGFAD